jgi:hypothetical protein
LAEGTRCRRSSLTVYSTVSAHHPRSWRGRGIFVRRRFLTSRRGRSRGHSPSRGARVFRPRSRDIDSLARHAARFRAERPLALCAHRLREPARRQCHGRAMSPRGSVRRSPHRPSLPRSPGLASRSAGLALTGVETPRAFGGFNQRPGDRSQRLDHGTNVLQDTSSRARFGLATSTNRRTLSRSE